MTHSLLLMSPRGNILILFLRTNMRGKTNVRYLLITALEVLKKQWCMLAQSRIKLIRSKSLTYLRELKLKAYSLS